MASHILPSAAYLHECFRYDPARGTLVWRKIRPGSHFSSQMRMRNWLTRHAGKNAYVEMRGQGYKRTRIDGVYYLSHRVIFKMMTGDDPKHEVDHINSDRGDNRWVNLRDVTHQQNSWSGPSGRKLRRSSSYRDLPTGIRRHAGKYQVQCSGKYLGLFKTLDEAVDAYHGYASVQRGEFYYKPR